MSESSYLLNTLRTRLKEIFDLERRLRELLNRLRDAEFPGAAHAATHSDGGTDEVSVTDLGGFPGGGTTFLRDDGTFAAAGAGTPSATVAPLDGTGSAGVSTDYSRGDHKHADANRPTDDEKDALVGTGTPTGANPYVTADTLLAYAAPLTHATRHQNGGADEVNVGGLSGVLADPQTVATDAAGALDGTGAAGSPLAVRVDGVTIIINGSNELEAVGGGTSPGAVLDGTHYPFTFTVYMSDGSVIPTGDVRFRVRIPIDGDGNIVEWHLHSEQTTNLEIDVLKNGVSITDGNNPELSTAQDADDTNLSDWDDQTVVNGDIIELDILVNSASELFEIQFVVERT